MIRQLITRHGLSVLLVLAIIRFGLVFESGLRYTIGDFYATLPGAYAEHVNPTLWNSPDLENVLGKQPSYLRGPTQYVTMYPVVYFDSYAAIARFLLIAYGVLILLVAESMYRMLRGLYGGAVWRAPIFITTLCYFPLLQAWIGREFEVIIVAAFVFACWSAVQDRKGLLGGVLGYITFYKYLPIIAVPYLLVRRWWTSLAGFLVAAGGLVLLAWWLVGLSGFVSNHIPGMAGSQLTSLTSTEAFCDGPQPLFRYFDGGDDVSLRTALCSLSLSVPITPAPLYILIILLTIGLAAYGTFRLERHGAVPPPVERWRRALEISLLAFVATTFFYTHAYYLAILILPLNVVLAHAISRPASARLQATLWGLAYVLLAVFLLPPSFLTRLLAVDVWRLYFYSLAYFSGEMLLLGLLLYQYVTLPLDSRAEQSIAA